MPDIILKLQLSKNQREVIDWNYNEDIPKLEWQLAEVTKFQNYNFLHQNKWFRQNSQNSNSRISNEAKLAI